jgi:hypothetical protein
LSQLAYISKLLPQFYSLQLEPKPLKRAASSQKNIKEELKAPVEIKKKSTKVNILLFRRKLKHRSSIKLILEIKETIINSMKKFKMPFIKSIIHRKIFQSEILSKEYLNL